MQNRLIIIKHTIVAGLLLCCGCAAKHEKESHTVTENLPYRAIVVQQSEEDTVWGYVILHNNRQLIKQFSIPALDGNRTFANQQQAALVGGLVADKLNHARHPGISKKELDSLGIIQSTHAIQKK